MSNQIIEIPDLGGIDKVTVLEVLVKVGDKVEKDTPLLSLESDKASMDIPSPFTGVIQGIIVKVGQEVSEGDRIMEITCDESDIAENEQKDNALPSEETPKNQAVQQEPLSTPALASGLQLPKPLAEDLYAGPGVRRLAHELDISLQKIRGTGDKGRITKDDLVQFIKASMQSTGGPSVGHEPLSEDVGRFGAFRTQSLNKIKQATAKHMLRCWSTIPQVTQCDRIDITGLEQFRQLCKPVLAKRNIRLTLLAFIARALVECLEKHPTFNAVYDTQKQALHIKEYYDIGVAVDTPQGLVVPAIRNVDKISIEEIALGLQEISQKARDGDLTPKDMMGAGMTISSLGGIGGDYFTPIVNGPQVAILGISKAQISPQWDGQSFKPALLMPVSMSYDHRVIDGAEAMRFLVDFAKILQGMQESTLVEGLGHH